MRVFWGIMISMSLAVNAFALTPAEQFANEDFAERCQAVGVIKCVGFDDAATDFVKGKLLAPDGQGVYRAGQDTEVKASGAGSLGFVLPHPSHAGANIAGSWAGFNAPILGQHFSQHS